MESEGSGCKRTIMEENYDPQINRDAEQRQAQIRGKKSETATERSKFPFMDAGHMLLNPKP
jgi:hypothetical protein